VSWELRKGRRVYYSAEKRDGRVVKVHIGRGAVGEVAAGLVAEARRRRADEAAALEAEKVRLAVPDRAMAALDEACGLAIEASLTAVGFHRFDYKWRRRHVRKTGPDDTGVNRRG
jgi:hypothetical protein